MDDTDYAFGRSRAEYDRLIDQAELIGPLTERMLLAAGVSRGRRVLDVGCGVGDVSFLVAGLVGPEGSVVGVDLDAEALKLAEERRNAKRINNIEFHQSDARSVNSGGLFDAAVGRFVLLFMSDPAEGLRKSLNAFAQVDSWRSRSPMRECKSHRISQFWLACWTYLRGRSPAQVHA